MRFKVAWEASALVIVLGALAMGCTDDTCDDALTHAQECGLEAVDAGDVDCSGEVECAANCYIQAPCSAFDNSDLEAAAAYTACLNDC